MQALRPWDYTGVQKVKKKKKSDNFALGWWITVE